MSLDDRLRSGTLSRRDVLKLGVSGLAGLVLASCGDVNRPPVLDPTPDPDPVPDPDPSYDPTLPPENPSGVSASEYWSSIGGHPGVDVSRIVAGSEDNSVAWFLDWLSDRIDNPLSGPLFSGSVGMTPEVAQSYVDRFGRFGNISGQARLAIETYFDARDALTQTVDQRDGGPFVHPDAYVSGWDVGVYYPHFGISRPGASDDLWYPIAFDSEPQITGLPRNDRFLGVRFADLNPEPNMSNAELDKIDNWLSLTGWDACRRNVTQDFPDNAPGFSTVIEAGYADSLPGGLPYLSALPWPMVVDEIRAFPGNTQLHLKATQIDRAVWDADHMYLIVAHLAQSPVRYEGWSYDPEFGVPAVGQIIPPIMNGARTVIASVSTQLSSRFDDARLLAPPGFGAGRRFNPSQPEAEFADYHLVDPFDVLLPPGKRLGFADGGRVHRPVWNLSSPSEVYSDRFDSRVVAPCFATVDGPVQQPNDITMR